MLQSLEMDELVNEDGVEYIEVEDTPYWGFNDASNDATNAQDELTVSTTAIDCFSLNGTLLFQFSSLNDVSTCLNVYVNSVRQAIQDARPLRGVKFAASSVLRPEVDWQTKAFRIALIKSPTSSYITNIEENHRLDLDVDPVECYNGKGVLLYRFRNIADAAQSLSIDAAKIRKVCQFKQRAAYSLSFNISIRPYEEVEEEVRARKIERVLSFKWKAPPSSSSKSANHVQGPVVHEVPQPQLDADTPIDSWTTAGHYLIQFRNMEDAATSLSIDADLIRKVCLKQKKHACGLKFGPSPHPYAEMEEEIRAATIAKIITLKRRTQLTTTATAKEKKKEKQEEEEELDDGDESDDSEHSSGSGYCITERHQAGDRYESSLRRRLRRLADGKYAIVVCFESVLTVLLQRTSHPRSQDWVPSSRLRFPILSSLSPGGPSLTSTYSYTRHH